MRLADALVIIIIIIIIENQHDVIFFFWEWSDLDKISQTGAEWHVIHSFIRLM